MQDKTESTPMATYNPLCMTSRGTIYYGLNGGLFKDVYSSHTEINTSKESDTNTNFETKILFFNQEETITAISDNVSNLMCAIKRPDGNSYLLQIDPNTGNKVGKLLIKQKSIIQMVSKTESQILGILNTGDLFELDTHNKVFNKFDFSNRRLYGIAYDPKNSRISLVMNEINESSIVILDSLKIAEEEGLVAIIKSPIPLSKAMAFSPNGQYLSYTTHGSKDNLRIWSLSEQQDIVIQSLEGTITSVNWIDDKTFVTLSVNSRQGTISHWSFVGNRPACFKHISSQYINREAICAIEHPENLSGFVDFHQEHEKENECSIQPWPESNTSFTGLPSPITPTLTDALNETVSSDTNVLQTPTITKLLKNSTPTPPSFFSPRPTTYTLTDVLELDSTINSNTNVFYTPTLKNLLEETSTPTTPSLLSSYSRFSLSLNNTPQGMNISHCLNRNSPQITSTLSSPALSPISRPRRDKNDSIIDSDNDSELINRLNNLFPNTRL